VVIFTGLSDYPDQDEYVDGQKELNRLGHEVAGYWYFDHDYWSNFWLGCYSGGAYILTTYNSLLKEEAHFISDIGNSDKNDFTQLYKATDTFDFGKYEYATEGDSMVIEVWKDKTESLVARLRVDNAEEVAAAEALWDEMMAYLLGAPGEYEMVEVQDYFPVNNYSVVVFLNGADPIYGDDANTTYFHYRADYKSDIWSFGEYQQCYCLSGCADMAAYINSLLVKYLAE
jgi:hypothetical protein